MKIIIIAFIGYLIYDYIRDRRIKKKLEKEKARTGFKDDYSKPIKPYYDYSEEVDVKRSDTNG